LPWIWASYFTISSEIKSGLIVVIIPVFLISSKIDLHVFTFLMDLIFTIPLMNQSRPLEILKLLSLSLSNPWWKVELFFR